MQREPFELSVPGPVRSGVLTEQDYFSQTVEYLRGQATKAAIAGDACLYRTVDGNACAVGWWVPDEMKPADFEGSVDVLLNYINLMGIAVPDTETGVELAGQLQRLHDDAVECGDNTLGAGYRLPSGGGLSEAGEARAREIAEGFGLMYSPPAVTAPSRAIE